MTPDPVDRAFDSIRDAQELAAPDRALEARLLAAHGWRRRRPRLLPGAIAGLVVAGGTFAAAGGVQWVRSFWVSVEVDGAAQTELVQIGEGTSAQFQLEGGGVARVDVATESLPGGALRTQVAIEQHDRGLVDVQELDEVVGNTTPENELVPLSVFAEQPALFAGLDDSNLPFALYALQSDGEDLGALLVVSRPHLDPLNGFVVGRLPQLPPAALPEWDCTLLPSGDLAVRVTVGNELDFELLVRMSEQAEFDLPTAIELESTDGRVKVRVEPDGDL